MRCLYSPAQEIDCEQQNITEKNTVYLQGNAFERYTQVCPEKEPYSSLTSDNHLVISAEDAFPKHCVKYAYTHQ